MFTTRPGWVATGAVCVALSLGCASAVMPAFAEPPAPTASPTSTPAAQPPAVVTPATPAPATPPTPPVPAAATTPPVPADPDPAPSAGIEQTPSATELMAGPSSAQLAAIAALTSQLDAAAGRLAETKAAYARAQGVAAAARKRLVAERTVLTGLRGTADAARVRLHTYVRRSYIDAPIASQNDLLSSMDVSSAADVTSRRVFLEMVGRSTDGNARAAQEILAAEQKAAEVVAADERAATADLVAAKAAADAAQTEFTSVSASHQQLTALIGSASAAAAASRAQVISAGAAQTVIGPNGCAITAPPNTMRDGSDAIGVYELCTRSVRAARTPAAARAIIYAFSKLGTAYSQGERMSATAFDCSSLVARSYAEGAGVSQFFGEAPNTAGYANPGPNVVTVSSSAARPGDIVILYQGSIEASGGNAGHAQMILADGYIIQSGGGADSEVNVSKFPDWPGWGMTLFTVKP